MTCADIHEYLQEALDGGRRLPFLPDGVRRHLEQCEACRAHWEGLQRAEAALAGAAGKADVVDEIPSGLHARIMGAVAAEPAPARVVSMPGSGVGRWMTTAGLVAAAAAAFWLVLAPRPTVPGSQGASHQSTGQRSPTVIRVAEFPGSVPTPTAERIRNAGVALAGLTPFEEVGRGLRDTAIAFADAARSPLRAVGGPASEGEITNTGAQTPMQQQ